MTFNFEDMLAEAYHLSVRKGRKHEAVKLILDSIQAHPEIALALQDKRDYLSKVREARRMPGDPREACHVTAALADLLKAALP